MLTYWTKSAQRKTGVDDTHLSFCLEARWIWLLHWKSAISMANYVTRHVKTKVRSWKLGMHLFCSIKSLKVYGLSKWAVESMLKSHSQSVCSQCFLEHAIDSCLVQLSQCWGQLTCSRWALQISYKAAFLACESLTSSPKSVSLRLLYIVPIASTKISIALEWYSAWADNNRSGQFDENIPFHIRNNMMNVELMFRIFAWTAKRGMCGGYVLEVTPEGDSLPVNLHYYLYNFPGSCNWNWG